MLSLHASLSTVVAAEGSNPWALPQAPMVENWQQQTGQQSEVDRSKKTTPQPQKMWRFVTPEILDSLKQQQIQMQLMPGRRVADQYQSRPSSSCPVQAESSPLPSKFVPGPAFSSQGSYYGRQPAWGPSRVSPGMPSEMHYGMNNANPVYDTPAVSPWGSGADVLYRGESFPDSIPGSVPSTLGGEFPGMSSGSFPWVPNEAMGGLLPIPVSPTVGDSYQPEEQVGIDEPANKKVEKSNEDNVFNPFTFLPSENLWQ